MRRIATLASLVALAGALTAPTAASADNSPNVHQIAQIPYLVSAISINFIDDTMFVSTAHGIYSYDVSNPASPKLLDALPMYIWENEDMDVDVVHKRIFISRDPRGFTSPGIPGDVFPYGAVHIIDVSNPSLMRQLNVFLVPAGHTTTCVDNCDFIWTSGPFANTLTNAGFVGRPIYATDVRDPMNPKPCPEPVDTGHNDGVTDYVHDVQVDKAGIAWVSGAGGVRGYWTSGSHTNPVTGATETATGCKPIPFAGSGTPESATSSRFMHNSFRDATSDPVQLRSVTASAAKKRSKKHKAKPRKKPKRKLISKPMPPPGPTRSDVLYGTEENIVSDCKTSGRFVTYDLRGTYNGEGFKDTAKTKHRMKVLDTWTPESQPGTSACDSSHYFSSRGDGLLVNAFYTQGVRFLDVSKPTDIRQVGYWRQSDSDTWAAYWHKGKVFVADFQRGVEVLEFGGAPGKARTVRAPVLATTAKQPLTFSRSFFGGLCPLTVPTTVGPPAAPLVAPASV